MEVMLDLYPYLGVAAPTRACSHGDDDTYVVRSFQVTRPVSWHNIAVKMVFAAMAAVGLQVHSGLLFQGLLKQNSRNFSSRQRFASIGSDLPKFVEVLSNNDLKRPGSVEGFEWAFTSFFNQDVQTFRDSMLLNFDKLQKQLDKDEFQEDRSMATFWVINKQFHIFIDLQFTWDYDSRTAEKYFAEYTRIEVEQFREMLLQHMGNVKKSVAERTRHKRQYDIRVNKRQTQTHASKVDSSKALDADLVVIESNGTESGKQDTSISSGNYLTHVVDADIRTVNDQMQFAEVQLNSQHNVLANEQQHTEQSEPIYDTYQLEKIDSNTTPDSTTMSLPVPKSSCGMSNGVPLEAHSRNSSSFLDSKHFVCSTCQKCVFNANHDDCITKFLKEVNSRSKVQSPMSRNNIKLAKRIPNVNKPERWISKGYRFSPNKSFAMHEKPNTLRSCLRWKPTGRIFKIAGLRWIPTGKMVTDNTTKVDSEPLNGSNDDITNPYECDQTLNVNVSTFKLSAGPAPQRKERCTLQCALSLKEEKSYYLRAVLSITSISSHARSVNKSGSYCCSRVVDPVGSPSLSTIDQDVPYASTLPTNQEIQSQVTHQGVKEQIHGHQNAQFNKAPLLHNLYSDLSSEGTT
nr:hypothetical protein [Tanacetum cinerariifolium]